MTKLDTAYNQVQLLVNKFNASINHYMSPTYSEAEARQDFIDNFFIALGWDVTHQTQTNPYEQEVKIERSQKQQNESARKRADYAFFLTPNYKDEVFFVEAKKPSVLIQSQPQHYFQTIRYGWNAGCPISVLTDFEEFVIIDCRAKPDIKYALNGKHKSYRYTDYTDKDKFAEIYWLFSREAVAAGSIKKYADKLPKAKGKVVQKALFKGGYQAIDDSFLEYIDAIRLNLAQAFKKNDESLDGEQLTEAVQRTVDRLVFIRFLEDKFIEAESHVNEWTSWQDFVTDCRKLDAKYNGVVFKKHFIDEQNFAGAEQRLFVDICQDMSSLNTPYDFNYIPIHILGSIYERFLGKVIRTTAKRVYVDDKPEVRKAGGVFYTPKYIVDYIVQNTVGKQIAGKTPKQIAELHFADIACGSGSFLIGVYDCLLDYHKKYYLDKLEGKTEIDKRSEDFGNVEYANNQWTLTLKLKQDILLNNVYGVDIDYQAVEVTQLSLFLKMLEDESLSSIGTRQGRMFAKVLPDLTKNIVCGNSLIGYDIMQMNGGLFEDTDLKKLNPLDYTGTFPKIMRNGGFDAIVGNPPYGADFSDESKAYFSSKYQNQNYQADSYLLFLEVVMKRVCKEMGILGYIIPNPWVTNLMQKNIRSLIFENYVVKEIVHFKYKVFKDATVDTQILLLVKAKPVKNVITIEIVEDAENNFLGDTKQIFTEQKEWQKLNGEPVNIFLTKETRRLFSKIKGLGSKLEDYFKINVGIKPYQVGKGIPAQKRSDVQDRVFDSTYKIDDTYRQIIRGKDVTKYLIQVINPVFISYGKWLAEPRPAANFDAKEKILVRQTGDSIIASIDSSQYLAMNNLHVLVPLLNIKPHFFLGILNSTLINWYYQIVNPEIGEALAEVKKTHVANIPIPKIDLKKPQQKAEYDSIVNCVTQLLAAKQKLAQAKEGREKDFLANQCNALDAQIDNLVYQLYGLTNEDIKIIEGS